MPAGMHISSEVTTAAPQTPHLQLCEAGGANDAGGDVPLACAGVRRQGPGSAAALQQGHGASRITAAARPCSPLHQASASSVAVMPCFCATFTYSATACLASDLV